jgi:hypothetical protein
MKPDAQQGGQSEARTGAAHVARVIAGPDLFVRSGANLGDGLGTPDGLSLDDVYELDAGAEPLALALDAPDPRGDPAVRRIAPGGAVGAPGDRVVLEARLTLMAPDGDRLDLLLLGHDAAGGGAAGPRAYYGLPLGPIAPRTEYALVAVDTAPGATRIADALCLSFARGTRIALGSGELVAVETLVPGSRVLTRDHGAQPVRWIGTSTLRARAGFAPVVIPAGTLGNTGDLIVGPHHRLFLYRRERNAGQPTAELLVQAQHLVDGTRIWRREGGYVDYFSLVFDHHEIIYAEGIPVESLMVNDAVLSRLPDDLAEAVRREFPALTQRQHFGTEIEAPPPVAPPRR